MLKIAVDSVVILLPLVVVEELNPASVVIFISTVDPLTLVTVVTDVDVLAAVVDEGTSDELLLVTSVWFEDVVFDPDDVVSMLSVVLDSCVGVVLLAPGVAVVVVNVDTDESSVD